MKNTEYTLGAGAMRFLRSRVHREGVQECHVNLPTQVNRARTTAWHTPEKGFTRTRESVASCPSKSQCLRTQDGKGKWGGLPEDKIGRPPSKVRNGTDSDRSPATTPHPSAARSPGTILWSPAVMRHSGTRDSKNRIAIIRVFLIMRFNSPVGEVEILRFGRQECQ